MTFDQRIKSMRRAGVPLVVVETEDQPNTVTKLLAIANGKTSVCQWDVARGLVGLNAGGQKLSAKLNDNKNPAETTTMPDKMLKAIYNVQEPAMIIMLNAHRYVENPVVSQAICNLRETFKQTRATLDMLCPSINLPPELRQDVMIVEDPLPTLEEIGGIVDDICEAAHVSDVGNKDKICDTLIGLSAFSGEQTLSTCLYLTDPADNNSAAIDRESLWDTKCKVISQTPGLSIMDNKETIDELDGCDNVIEFLKSMDGQYRGVLLIDEVDKGLSAVSTDSSGVTQDQNSVFLTYMQDHDIDGCIFMGVAGSGKSAVAKAIAKHYGVVGMSYDIGASKSKYVGETGQHTRQVFRVVDAVTQGKVLMIATCNNMAVLPPEFRRRFTLGTFFFDSPPESAKKKIWGTYERKFEVGEGARPEDNGWTGAEIRQCCKLSAKMKGSKVEAGKYIVPVTISAKEQIDLLRNQATGKFISAAKSGVYNKDEIMIEAPVMRKVRKMNLKDIES